MSNYSTSIDIDQRVDFRPNSRDCEAMCIDADNIHYGTVVGIRFTKAKVFYDCSCDYYGIVFRDIPSDYVRIPVNIKLEG